MTPVFHVLTLFPDYFESPLQSSLLGKAVARDLLRVNLVQLRDFADNAYGKIDDQPYGGGPGMVIKAAPVVSALREIEAAAASRNRKVIRIMLAANGTPLTQKHLSDLRDDLHNSELVIIAGHYEGIDDRVRQHYTDLNIRIGDYVLSGGEPAAMVLIDGIARLIPGFMGNEKSAEAESFAEPGYLEHPHYTRPEEFEGHRVPDVLLSGNHKLIAEWRARGFSPHQKAAGPPEQAR